MKRCCSDLRPLHLGLRSHGSAHRRPRRRHRSRMGVSVRPANLAYGLLPKVNPEGVGIPIAHPAPAPIGCSGKHDLSSRASTVASSARSSTAAPALENRPSFVGQLMSMPDLGGRDSATALAAAEAAAAAAATAAGRAARRLGRRRGRRSWRRRRRARRRRGVGAVGAGDADFTGGRRTVPLARGRRALRRRPHLRRVGARACGTHALGNRSPRKPPGCGRIRRSSGIRGWPWDRRRWASPSAAACTRRWRIEGRLMGLAMSDAVWLDTRLGLALAALVERLVADVVPRGLAMTSRTYGRPRCACLSLCTSAGVSAMSRLAGAVADRAAQSQRRARRWRPGTTCRS